MSAQRHRKVSGEWYVLIDVGAVTEAVQHRQHVGQAREEPVHRRRVLIAASDCQLPAVLPVVDGAMRGAIDGVRHEGVC